MLLFDNNCIKGVRNHIFTVLFYFLSYHIFSKLVVFNLIIYKMMEPLYKHKSRDLELKSCLYAVYNKCSDRLKSIMSNQF